MVPHERKTGRSNTKPPQTRWLAGLHVVHQQETIRYVFVSALDLFMTFLLLYASESGWTQRIIFESNPVADYFYGAWGIRGLIYFKFAVVALVVIIAQIIAAHRPKTARGLLNAATVVVFAVIVYSTILFVRNVSWV